MRPEIDFRGLTPKRSWEAADRDAVLEVLLARWFAYLAARDGQIGWMRVVCSGFRPVSRA